VKTLKRNYARICPGPMSPPSPGRFKSGSPTTTRTIPARVCACAHLVCSPGPKLGQPCVRFDKGNSASPGNPAELGAGPRPGGV
jgi:hypothetical protein